MPSDTSPADFVVYVFCSWGQKAQVVNIPAANSSRSIPVIVCHPSAKLTLPCYAALPSSNLLVKTNGPVLHF